MTTTNDHRRLIVAAAQVLALRTMVPYSGAGAVSVEVLSVVEPLIRADERERLRAKVEALHGRGCDSYAVLRPGVCDCMRNDVLALFDGGE